MISCGSHISYEALEKTASNFTDKVDDTPSDSTPVAPNEELSVDYDSFLKRLKIVPTDPKQNFPITKLADKFIFAGQDNSHGIELWSMDLNGDNKKLVKDIFPGSDSSKIKNLVVINNIALFFADDGTTGYELWRSDGTAEGTFLLFDTTPENRAHYDYSLNQNQVVFFNDYIYFTFDHPDYGKEIWKTQGEKGSTSLVSDYETGANNFSPRDFRVIGTRLLFIADTLANGQELFYLENDTINLLYDFTSDASDGLYNSSTLVQRGSEVFFTSQGNLWKSDGTIVGTTLLSATNPFSMTLSDNFLYAEFDSGNGQEPHLIDPNTGTLTELADTTTGAETVCRTYFTPAEDGDMYITIGYTSGSCFGSVSWKIWYSDGTVLNTKEVMSIPGFSFSHTPPFSHFRNNKLYLNFSNVTYEVTKDALNNFTQNTLSTTEKLSYVKDRFWVYVDSVTKKVNIFNIDSLSNVSLESENFIQNGDFDSGGIFVFKDKLIFSNNQYSGFRDFYIYDPLTEATSPLKGSHPTFNAVFPSGGSSDADPVVLDDYFLYKGSDPVNGRELWISDGTPGGTNLISDFTSGTSSSNFEPYASTGNTALYFANIDAGRSLFCYDANTDILHDLGPFYTNVFTWIKAKAFKGDYIVYIGTTNSNFDLWRISCDGSTRTQILDDKTNGNSLVSFYDTKDPDYIYFRARDNMDVYQDYKTDGTLMGTTILNSTDKGMKNYQGENTTYFCDGNVLSEYDVLNQTTTPLYDFSVELGGAFSCNGVTFTFNSGKVIFMGDIFSSPELFSYDPMTATVTKITNFLDDGGAYGVHNFLYLGNKMYFGVNQGIYGNEQYELSDTEDGLNLKRVGFDGFRYGVYKANGQTFIQVVDEYGPSLKLVKPKD